MSSLKEEIRCLKLKDEDENGPRIVRLKEEKKVGQRILILLGIYCGKIDYK